MIGRILRYAVALLFAGTSPVLAQVDRVSPAFQLTHFEKVGNDYFYRYRLVGRGSGAERISDVYLQITQPVTPSRPRVSPIRGVFLFDALARESPPPQFGHPPLRIATPPNWSAAIYLQGVLSWGADRWAMGPNHGVLPNEVLEGFELISPALPALRRFRAVPYRPVATLVDDPAARDTTWILHTGVVLAPGWEASLVTGAYLMEQVRLACDSYLLENCGRYLRLSDDVIEAENRRNDRAYNRALDVFAAFLKEDKGSHRNATFVLSVTIDALRKRTPSQRGS